MTTPSEQWTARRILALPLIVLVRAYQLVVSPMLPPSCRYYPSCSAYALTALTRHGPLRGTWLAVRRVLRCHPWALGGVDHVPPRRGEHLDDLGRPVPDLPDLQDLQDLQDLPDATPVARTARVPAAYDRRHRPRT